MNLNMFQAFKTSPAQWMAEERFFTTSPGLPMDFRCVTMPRSWVLKCLYGGKFPIWLQEWEQHWARAAFQLPVSWDSAIWTLNGLVHCFGIIPQSQMCIETTQRSYREMELSLIPHCIIHLIPKAWHAWYIQQHDTWTVFLVSDRVFLCLRSSIG